MLKRIFALRVSSAAFDVRLGQALFFVGGPTVLIGTWYTLARLSLTQGEAVSGMLASLAVALLLILMGMVLPLADRKDPGEMAGWASL